MPIFFLASECWQSEISNKCQFIWFILAFRVINLRKDSLFFQPSRNHSFHFYRFWSFEFKHHWFRYLQWRADGPEMLGSAISLDIRRKSNFFLWLYLFHFPTKVSIDSLGLMTAFSCQNIMKFFLHGIEILMGQKWQKCFQLRCILIFQLILLKRYSIEF